MFMKFLPCTSYSRRAVGVYDSVWDMLPAFYGISTPAPPQATSSPSSSGSSSVPHFPILVIVLGFIGALVLVLGIAGTCIYVFRGRLLAPEHIFDLERGLANGNNSHPSNSSDALTGDIPRRSEVRTSALRPLLLGRTSVTSKRGPYKPLRLPQMQLERQLQSYQAVSHRGVGAPKHRPQPPYQPPTNRQNFPFSRCVPPHLPYKHSSSEGSSEVLEAPQIVPISPVRDIIISGGVSSDHTISQLKGCNHKSSPEIYKPVNCVLSDSHPDLAKSTNSAKLSFFISRRCPWNHLSGSTMLDTPPELLPVPSWPASESSEDSELYCLLSGSLREDSMEDEGGHPSVVNDGHTNASSVDKALPETSKSRVCRSRSLPRNHRLRRGVVARKWRSSVGAGSLAASKLHRAIAAASLKSFVRVHSARTLSNRPKSSVQDVSVNPAKGPKRKPESTSKEGLLRRKTSGYTRLSSTASRSKKSAARTQRPLDVITNALGTLSLGPPPPPRPMLLLNGVPTDKLESMGVTSPPRVRHTPTPPRDPTMLSARWAPRSVKHPLALTVLVKGNSTHPTAYLSALGPSAIALPSRSRSRGGVGKPDTGVQTLSVGTYAENTLADLRGAVEASLGYRVYLRGMVRVGPREIYLPLLGERFFRQWVKERMKEGGEGVVEAWRKDY